MKLLANYIDRVNPYPAYDQLRDRDPVYFLESGGFWLLSSYEAVTTALRDPRLSSATATQQVARIGELLQEEYPDQAVGLASGMQPLRDLLESFMIFKDGEEHSRIRNTVGDAFKAQAVEAMRPMIQTLVDELLDDAEASREFDFIGDIALRLPAAIMTELLGLPAKDRERIKDWCVIFGDFFISMKSGMSAEYIGSVMRSGAEFSEYLQPFIAERRATPGDDLISAMLTADGDGRPLSDQEVLANAIFLAITGHGTATSSLGNGMLALLQHPDQCQRLREEPALMRNAVQEMMRYDGPAQFVGRIASEDFELLGKTIKKGQFICALLAAANRDPKQFPDPNRFDIERPVAPNVALGVGSHYCPGAGLGRLQMEVFFETFLRRAPNIRLESDSLEYRECFNNRGLISLPLSW